MTIEIPNQLGFACLSLVEKGMTVQEAVEELLGRAIVEYLEGDDTWKEPTQ